jgi:hypothetical protein
MRFHHQTLREPQRLCVSALSFPLATPHSPLSLLRRRQQLNRCAESRVKIPIAERRLQRRKRGLAGAVARRDVLHFIGVMQGRDDFLYVRIARHNQVEPSSNDVDARIDGRRRGNDLVEPWMGTSHHDRHALRRIDGQR